MDNQIQKDIDEKSRKLILGNIKENYFVEAGAGSGKTTTLVGRMVKMIEEGVKIEHISAITFTKAAANEFYDRFQKKLIEESLKNNEHKQKYIDALQDIDLAFMGTIDSFCNMIMSEHPNEGLIPSNATIIDEDKAKQLYEREYTNIQNGRYNDPVLEKKARLFIKYDSYAKESFVRVLQSVLDHRDCELEIPSITIENIDEKYKDNIKTIRKIVKVLVEHKEYIRSSNDEKADKIRQAIENNKYIFDGEWDNNTSKITKAFKETFFSGYNKKTNASDFRLYFSDEVREQLKEGIDYFVSNKDSWYNIDYDKLSFALKYIETIKYVTTLDFVNYTKDKILDILRKEGNLTFNDYLVYLRDTLRKDANEDGKLIKHIYKRHKYFLIDEFQDTDPIQAEIFFYLAAEDIKPNWQDCIPHKGSLFIVGDPKQSIYRFKNADVASYLKVENMFDDVSVSNPKVGNVLHLYSNFRSTVELRNWFNLTFKELLPTQTDDQAPYEDIPIDEDDKYCGEFSNVYKYNVGSRPKGEDKDEYKVANIILKIHKNDKYKIVEKKKDEDGNKYIDTRTIDWKDIMLITPSKPALANYTKVFREKSIPYFVEGNIKFSESKAFMAFVDFFGAVVNPNDNRYLYKVLKSDIYHIKESELSDANNSGYVLNVMNDVDNLNISDNLKEALIQLKKFSLISRTIGSSSLFTRIIEEIKAFKVFGIENMEYVYFALELLKSKEESREIITHIDALNFFNNLLSKDNEQERCFSLQANTNQVHLANLHKVKGLEAPVVILAHPNGKDREPSFRMTRFANENKGYVFNVSKKLENGSIKIINTDIFDHPYKDAEQESSNAENIRLQYVAATRAKNALIISNQVTAKGPSEANPWFDLLKYESSKKSNDIELVLSSEEIPNGAPRIVSYVDNTDNIIKKNEETLCTPSYEQKSPSKVVSNNDAVDVDVDIKTQKHIDENTGDTLATIIGTIVHRLMELMIMSKKSVSKQDMIYFIIEENVTNEFIDKKQYFINMLENVYDVMHSGGFVQKGKAPQDILPIILSADKYYSEVPFTIKIDNNIWNGIIDLIYEKDGKLHIIDWKTNKDDEGLDEHYKNQLDAYKQAVKESLHQDVEDALIYHIDVK